MEALRYLPWLSKEGWIVTNTHPVCQHSKLSPDRIDNGRAPQDKNTILVDVDTIARDVATHVGPILSFWVHAATFLGMESQKFEEGIRRIFFRQGRRGRGGQPQSLRAGRCIT